MSFEKARDYLKNYGFEERIHVFDISTATVELAAAAVGCEPGMIAKTLSFMQKDGPVVIVMAGDCKIDNKKYKGEFKEKAHMLSFDMAPLLIGHAVGGVCPFGVNDGVKIYLDASLRKFDTVYPAAGSSNSAVKLTPDELQDCLPTAKWIDVSAEISAKNEQ